MTAPPAPAGVRIGPEGLPPDDRTLGWAALAWTSEWLQHPDGPRAGEPWRYTTEQARFVLWWYAIDDLGRFTFRRGMLRRMKGWGKDPVGATLCAVEFLGPCRFGGWDRQGKPAAVTHPAAWIQTAAVSKDQTRNTMTLFPGLFTRECRSEYGIDLGKEIIYANHGAKRIEAVTSSPRALEGGRPTFVLKNETHHWLSSNEGHAMSDVITRNLAKSRDGSARVLAISNAHSPGEDSDAERDFEAYQKIAQGQNRTTDFLYDSLEAPPDTELADEASLRAGLLSARGDSEWLDIDRLVAEIYDPRTPPSTSRRFYLNQIHATEDAWVTPQEWDACAAPGEAVEPGEQVTLGFDGSKSDDNTALIGCRVSDSHLFVIRIWDPAKHGGEIPRKEVDDAVEKAFADFDVVGFYSDVHPWESYIDKWEEAYSEQLCVRVMERHPVGWDMRSRKQETTRAMEQFHDAIVEGDLSHDGDKRFAEHIYNARRMPNNYGVTFRKESPFSAKKVDAAAAAGLARKARQDYLVLPENKKRNTSPRPSPSVYVGE